MATYVEPNNIADLLLYELDRAWSREETVIASGQNLKMGAVVGKITASGEIAEIDFDATDGTEAAYGVLMADYDASSEAVNGLVIAGFAMLNPTSLVWPDGATDEQKNAALAELEAKHNIFREAV